MTDIVTICHSSHGWPEAEFVTDDLKKPTTAHQAKMLARYDAIMDKRLDTGTAMSAADRALIYRVRKLGLAETAQEDRAEQRALNARPREPGMSSRTLRRYAPKNGPRRLTAAERNAWLAAQPPDVQAECRDIAEFNRLFEKWKAFIYAWRRATADQQRELQENIDLIGNIEDAKKKS